MVDLIGIQLMIGDWDRVTDQVDRSRVRKNGDVFLEWKWNQGIKAWTRADERTRERGSATTVHS